MNNNIHKMKKEKIYQKLIDIETQDIFWCFSQKIITSEKNSKNKIKS